MRAYTYIDVGRASLGNRWFERRWSGFLGTSVELWTRPEGQEWLGSEGPELLLRVNGELRDNMQLGAVDWSEECNEFGAVLVARRQGPPEVILRTICFHEAPGMVRSMRVLNNSGAPMVLGPPTIEALPLQRGFVLYDGYTSRRASLDEARDERAVAISDGERGWILGLEGGAHYELFAPAPTLCAIVGRERIELAPGEHWDSPGCYLAPFQGDPAVFSSREFSKVLRQYREWKAWEQRLGLGLADGGLGS